MVYITLQSFIGIDALPLPVIHQMIVQLDKLYITYERSIAQSFFFDKASESISKKCYPATNFDFITRHSISTSLARMVTDTLIHFDTRKCLRLASFSLYHRVCLFLNYITHQPSWSVFLKTHAPFLVSCSIAHLFSTPLSVSRTQIDGLPSEQTMISLSKSHST